MSQSVSTHTPVLRRSSGSDPGFGQGSLFRFYPRPPGERTGLSILGFLPNIICTEHQYWTTVPVEQFLSPRGGGAASVSRNFPVKLSYADAAQAAHEAALNHPGTGSTGRSVIPCISYLMTRIPVVVAETCAIMPQIRMPRE